MKKWKFLGTGLWMVGGGIGVIVLSVHLMTAGNRDRGPQATGVLSLLDQIAEEEPAGLWSLAAYVREWQPDPHEKVGRDPHAGQQTTCPLTRHARVDLPGGTTVLTRVTYPRRWGQGGKAELLAWRGEMIVARREASLGSSWQEFRLKIPDGGADLLELLCHVPQGMEMPPTGLAALVMDHKADARDWQRASALLAWAARQPPNVALAGLRWLRFHLVQATGSIDILAVAAGDSFTFDVPHPFRGGRLEFELIGLRRNLPSDAALHVDVREQDQWQATAVWKLKDLRRDGRQRLRVELPSMGDGIRFVLAGTDEVVGIGMPLVRPRHPSGDATNLVLIDLDTMRADRLESYGYTTRPTSNALDSLLEAAGFVVFRSAFSGGPYTIAATPKFLASRFMNIHEGEAIPRSNLMLAEILRSNGYYCAAFTGGAVLRCPGFEQGFHEYYFTEGIGKAEGVFPPAGTWLAANTERPFFLFIHTYESHVPYTRDVFCKQLPHGKLGDISAGEQLLAGVTRVWDRESAVRQLTAEESLYVEAAYDGGVKIATEATVRFLAAFDRLGLWDNTVVAILSDHGEEFWEHTGAFAYHSGQSVYNELLRVPFMMRTPGAAGGRICFVDQTVSTVDLVPTVLHFMGLSSPAPLDGANLAPVMKGDVLRRMIPVLATNDPSEGPPRTCVFANDLKYVGPDSASPLGELYDLREDPYERTNLAAQRPHDRQKLAWLLDQGVHAAARPVSSNSDTMHALPDALRAQLRMLGYLDRD